MWVDLGFAFTMMIANTSNRGNLYLKNNKNLQNKKYEQKIFLCNCGDNVADSNKW
jgi:hypothetical protein